MVSFSLLNIKNKWGYLKANLTLRFCQHPKPSGNVSIAREAGLPYVYLGYWVAGSSKMGYKARFSSLEVYRGGEWQDIGDPGDYSSETHPLSTDPIAEQVARISLPDTRPT